MKTAKIAPAIRISCENTLGEGVVWDHRSNAVLWTDIEKRLLYRSRFPFEHVEAHETPERIGSFALLADREEMVLAAFETGFGFFTFQTGEVEWIHRPTLPKAGRFNDGRTDRNGVFWAGSMIEDASLRPQAKGALFRLGENRKAIPVINDIQISNSLCWSPDGATMYFADTPSRTIHVYDFVEGEPRNKRVFAKTDQGAYPDGSAVDAEGRLWNAQWGAGQVVRYTPDGKPDMALKIPAPHVTCVAFGGPSLNHLIVTTARAEMSEDALLAAPEAGSLFIYETDYQGLPESLCSLSAETQPASNPE